MERAETAAGGVAGKGRVDRGVLQMTAGSVVAGAGGCRDECSERQQGDYRDWLQGGV